MRDGTRHDIRKVTVHPNWRRRDNIQCETDFDFDFAIIELAEPLDLTGESRARAACLPSPTDTQFAAGTTFTASGWGLLRDGKPPARPDVLQTVEVPHVSDQICEEAYQGCITPHMICAGFQEGGRDTCQGDSGGKFLILNYKLSQA